MHPMWSCIVTGLIGGVSALLMVDSYGSPMTVLRVLGIASSAFVVPALLVQLFLRQRWSAHPPRWFSKVLGGVALPLVALAAVVLTVWDFVSPLNTVFAATRLHQQGLTLVLTYWLVAWLLSQTKPWWKGSWRRVVAWTPVVGFFLCLLASMWPLNVYLELVKEDRLFEWVQFWVLLVGVGVAWYYAWALPAKRRWWKACLVLLGIGFVLVAGDEISWGQRLLSLEVSDGMKQLNRQGELSIHNLYIFEWAMLYVFFLMSFAGSFGWLIKKTRLRQWAPFVPSPLLFGYFFLPLVFYAVQIYKIPHGLWHAWSEPLELFLYAGLVLWVGLLGKHLLAQR